MNGPTDRSADPPANRPIDVLVIGGGIIGCWTAWHLARLGCQVTIVERNQIGSGASLGNCGYICPSHVRPLCGPGAIKFGLRTMAKFGGALSIPPRWDPPLWNWLLQFATHCTVDAFRNASIARHVLLRSSREQYQRLASTAADDIKWHQNGLLTVYRSAREFDAYEKQASELRNEFGIRVDRLDSEKLCSSHPSLRDDLAGGWHFPDDAHLSPIDLLDRLRRDLQGMGVIIREQTEVRGLCFDGRRLVSIQSGTGDSLPADRFVFTTGAEIGCFGKELGCHIPVVPGKGYSVTISDASGMPTTPMIFEDDHVGVTSFGDSFRVGSTMQLTGFSRTIPEKRIELLKRSARKHLCVPLPEGPEERWSGWRPMMPDGIPCIGPALTATNAFVAAGNGMIGIASGPATGQLVAELATGITPHLDPQPYRMDRFTRSKKTVPVHLQSNAIEGSS